METDKLIFKVIFDGKDAQKGLKDLKKSLKDIQTFGAKHLTRTFAKLASIVGFTKMTLDASNFARSMTYLAQKTGIASAKLSNMKTAFDRVNGSGDQAVKLVERIGKGVAGAKFGDFKTVSQLSKMGIGYKGRSAEDIMYDMADWAHRQIKSGAMNLQELTVLFEKEFGIGGEWTRIMAEGSAYLKKQAQESKDAVGEETQEGIEKRNKLANALSQLHANFERLKNQIITELAPVLTKIIEKFAELIGWCSRHSEFSAIVTSLILLFSSLQGLKWLLGIGTFLKSLGGAGAVAGASIGKAILTGLTSFLIPAILAFFEGKWIGEKIAELNQRRQKLGFSLSKWWNQKTVTDAEYWDEFQAQEYARNRMAGMSPEQAHMKAQEAANFGRKANKLKTQPMSTRIGGTESTYDETYGFNPDNIPLPIFVEQDGKLIPLEKAPNGSVVQNAFEVNTEVLLNPDGSSTTTTEINGNTYDGSNVKGISFSQKAAQGGSV